MKEGLELSNTEAGALATGNFIGYLSLAMIGGLLASKFSPRRVISISLFVVGITVLLTGFSGGFYMALLWRTITGMGSGGSNVPAMGLLSSWFSPRRRGLATGIGVAGSSIALIVTGALVPRILRIAGPGGWRQCWMILGLFIIAFALFSWFTLRNRPGEKGLKPVGEKDDKDNDAEKSGAVLKPEPTLGHVYKSLTVWHLALIYATFGFSYIIFCTFFAEYLQEEMGYTASGAGRLWQMVGWISIFCGLIWGWVSDMIGRKFALAIVSFLQGLSYIIFSVSNGLAGHLTSAIIFGVTAWSIPAIMAATCGDRLGPRLASAALGFITLFFGIAQALGPMIAGRIGDVKETLAPAFILAGAVAWCGAVLSLFLSRQRET